MSVIILFCLSFLLVEYISWHFKGEKVQKNTQIVMCFLLLFIFFGFRDLPILNGALLQTCKATVRQHTIRQHTLVHF